MNDLIEELIEKATEKVANEGKDMWIGRPHYRRVFNKELFAKLIVNECSNWIDANVGMITPEAKKDLLEHFGIEQ